MVGRDALLDKPGKTEAGGGVVRARYLGGDDARVEAGEAEGYDWWRGIRRG